jgi:peptidase inhibitor family I36
MKLVKTAVAVGAAVTAAMGLGTATAAAAPSDVEPFAYSACPSGRMCLFDGLDGATLINPTVGTCGVVNYGSLNPARNDRADSFRNRTGSTAYLYDHLSSGVFVLVGVVPAGEQGNLLVTTRNVVDQVAVDC